MSYLSDISIMINRMISYLLFCLFFRVCPIVLDDNVDENVNNFEIANVQPQGIV